MAEQLHKNHRERVLEKFRRFGLDTFADHEVLELLLFFAIPRVDTNPIAHRLMARFGSLHAVLEAPAEQLCEVEGIGPRSADLIKLAFLLGARYRRDVAFTDLASAKLNTYERIGEYFVPQFADEREEVLLAAYLDGAGRVIKCEEIARGGHAQVSADPYKIARTALLCGAKGVALAHNHPDGTATPSEEDMTVTRRLEQVLAGLGVELVDHCVVARGKYTSICQLRRGLMGKRR